LEIETDLLVKFVDQFLVLLTEVDKHEFTVSPDVVFWRVVNTAVGVNEHHVRFEIFQTRVLIGLEIANNTKQKC